ncbi:MAG TPA: peptidylprolyl isomerase [Planctomycetota bacterium]|nr:peptidylprolyl isomerase [Planctomycetota bacterium]
MFAGLLLQVSMFVSPMFRGAEPPESRSARALVIGWNHAAKPEAATRREAAEAFAKQLAAELRAGRKFEELCARARGFSGESGGGVLGTFFPELLAPPIDHFLFHAAELEVSDPIETDTGFQVVQRVERFAGCRALLIAGNDEAARRRADLLLRRLASGGVDFAEIARSSSDDAASAARGGAVGIFERGPSDSLLKSAVFQLRIGEIGGPVESPLGWHLVQRVEPSTLDASLADDTVARARLILVAFEGAHAAPPTQTRKHEAAERLARELWTRVRAGEDMADLAAQNDDDTGGRERRGDLGWIRRRSAQIPGSFDRIFSLRPGETAEPFATNAGWLLLRRER